MFADDDGLWKRRRNKTHLVKQMQEGPTQAEELGVNGDSDSQLRKLMWCFSQQEEQRAV